MTCHVFGIVHHLADNSNTSLSLFSGCIHHSEIYKVMCSMSPPVGFGKKCPKIVGYKVCISIFIPCYYIIFLGITPNLPITRRRRVTHLLCWPLHFESTVYTLAYSSCVYRENATDPYDIPGYTTRERCITRIFLLFMINLGISFMPSFFRTDPNEELLVRHPYRSVTLQITVTMTLKVEH